MYEEKSKKGLNINWKSLIIKLAILFVVFFIILWIISLVNKPKKEEKASNITTNLQTMKEAALDYFTGSNLPESVNGKKKITLQEMVSEKLLIEFKDQDDKTCNKTESYAEATKINSTDYSIKVKLVCSKDTDYVINTIHVEKDTNSETNNNEETSVDNTTTNNSENLSNSTSTSTNNTSNKNNTSSTSTSNKNNTSTSNKNNTSNSNNNSTNTSNKNNNSNIAISNTCSYGKKEYTTVYPLAYVVSGNCAVSKATLGQATHMNTVTMMGAKEYTKLYNEINTLKNQTGAELIVSDGEYIPVMNASGYGYVGYQIRFQVKQKTNYLEKTIYSYYINQNGERVVVIDNRSSLNSSNNNSSNGTTSSDIKVTSVSFSKSSLDLYVGETSNLKVTINPTNATNKTITWSSSNTKVASVSSTGKVTAKRAGTAIITATVDGKSDTIKIYVEEEEEATNVYCERVTERIYSISYISKNSLNLGKILDYEILLPIDTTNIRDLDIEYGVATDYVSAYNYWKNKNIIFAGGSTSNLDPGSATNLKAYSLKPNHFSTIVDYEGIYDNVLDFRIRDYLDSKSNLGLDYKGNYYLPIYIDVAYTNNSKCKALTDSEAKSTKYSNYVKVN